jgi:hypothetical protein
MFAAPTASPCHQIPEAAKARKLFTGFRAKNFLLRMVIHGLDSLRTCGSRSPWFVVGFNANHDSIKVRQHSKRAVVSSFSS